MNVWSLLRSMSFLSRRKFKLKQGYYLVLLALGLYGGWAWGIDAVNQGAGGATLDGFASTIKNTFQQLSEVMTAAAYIAGVSFSIIGLLKFKAHKDNPAQIPLSTPIALLAVSAGLLFLPTVFQVSGNAIFGDKAQKGISDTNRVGVLSRR